MPHRVTATRAVAAPRHDRDPTTPRRRPLDRIELGALLAVGIVFVLATAVPLGTSFAVAPERLDSGEVQITRTCPHKARTGQPCLSCGMTRAFASASHGRPGDAWRYNRAALPLYGLTWLTFLFGGGAVLYSGRGLLRLRQGGVH